MSDELQQLLRRADTSAPAPALDTTDLPNRIRRTARNQRRLAACGLALLLLLICSPFVILRNTPVPDAPPAVITVSTPEFDAILHERTAALLQAHARPHRATNTTDLFLVNLQMERDRAALVLLRDARRDLDRGDPLAQDALKLTVQLFPDTPAATLAATQLKQLEFPKRQS